MKTGLSGVLNIAFKNESKRPALTHLEGVISISVDDSISGFRGRSDDDEDEQGHDGEHNCLPRNRMLNGTVWTQTGIHGHEPRATSG